MFLSFIIQRARKCKEFSSGGGKGEEMDSPAGAFGGSLTLLLTWFQLSKTDFGLLISRSVKKKCVLPCLGGSVGQSVAQIHHNLSRHFYKEGTQMLSKDM